jgi:hypothetical protein
VAAALLAAAESSHTWRGVCPPDIGGGIAANACHWGSGEPAMKKNQTNSVTTAT